MIFLKQKHTTVIYILLFVMSVFSILSNVALAQRTSTKPVSIKELVQRDGVFYKKFATTPFTGKFIDEGSAFKIKGQLRDGKHFGTQEYYYNDRLRDRIIVRESGEVTVESFHENGKVMVRGTTKDKKKIGIWEFFHESGVLKEKGVFDGDNKVGKWEHFNDAGEVIATEDWKEGASIKNGLWQEFHDNGQLYFQGKYINNKKEGIWNYYYGDGSLESERAFENDKRNGEWRAFYRNGNLKNSGNYLDGKEEGQWNYYYQNEVKSAVKVYKNGLKDGEWKFFWGNGNLNYSQIYKNGMKDGIWKTFTEDGKLKNVTVYLNDEELRN